MLLKKWQAERPSTVEFHLNESTSATLEEVAELAGLNRLSLARRILCDAIYIWQAAGWPKPAVVPADQPCEGEWTPHEGGVWVTLYWSALELDQMQKRANTAKRQSIEEYCGKKIYEAVSAWLARDFRGDLAGTLNKMRAAAGLPEKSFDEGINRK